MWPNNAGAPNSLGVLDVFGFTHGVRFLWLFRAAWLGWSLGRIAIMSKMERVISIFSCVVAAIGAIWAFVCYAAISMSYGVGGSGAKVPPQHVPLSVFPLPICAILLASIVLILTHRHGAIRASLWFTMPAVFVSVLILLLASESLP